ncbi:beta-CASP ribonuclease aCPSF1 [Candidatus Woesearchaeota archaeon]|nr:beta-CASP ribonuclease aCPSF1 [Candidatus Woesearchaeota archaeon]
MATLNKISKEILKFLPEDKISEIAFEAANIVLYTKDKDFFFDNGDSIKPIVDSLKKRIELRPDPDITIPKEKAEEIIRKIIPEEAGISEIIFDTRRSRVIIETDKPGVAIGKQGSLLRDIKTQTLWVPLIRRAPPMKSKLITNIRNVLYENSEYRRKFLDKTGHRIYDGWIREKKHEWVRLTYLGSGRHVGKSCIFLQTPESRILLDVGVDVSTNDENAYPYLDAPEFKIDELDAVIISHSHLDHCGFVPYLFKYGYRGPVYCTAPTRDTMALLVLDYIKIMKNDNREPIFDVEDVKQMVMHTICLDYEEVSDITPDVRITLYNAGHVLGSSMVHLHVGNGLHNILYTGDMKFARTQLLEPSVTEFPRLETLMIEATYGGKTNIVPSRKECEMQFAEFIKSVVERKGKILIPVLGVGRAQEVMMIVSELIKAKYMPEIPIFIEGMIWDVTAIHSAYPEFLNSDIRKLIFHKNENPFLSPLFRRVASAKERKEVLEDTGSCIVMATSGMLMGGPSVQYLKEFADSPRNMLLFVSYQAENTLGRRIQRGDREVTFPTGSNKVETVALKLEIQTLEGFTGHSDRRQLMNFIYKCTPKPKKVIINHGEASRCLDFASSIYKMYGIETTAPKNLEAVRLK